MISSPPFKAHTLEQTMRLKDKLLQQAKRRLLPSRHNPLDLSPNERCKLALKWIKAHTVPSQGIVVTSKNTVAYPEVTGYFIPTLLKCGETERALSYGDWLISIQNKDGSWNAPKTNTPYTFDTGQILKGMAALIPHSTKFVEPTRRGCDWLLQQQRLDGSLSTPDATFWGNIVPEAIHLYTLEPLRQAAALLEYPHYEETVQKALQFYKSDPSLTEFSTLSHFHAYIIEALVDLGEREMAENAMQKVAELQRKDGAVPAWRNKKWVCSTGLFQYALIWYKLGQHERADSAYNYALTLQNKTGGFFGSYGYNANYFPDEEISWAVKYMLDGLFKYKSKHISQH